MLFNLKFKVLKFVLSVVIALSSVFTAVSSAVKTPLHDEVMRSNWTARNYFTALEEHPDWIKQPDSNGSTPIHYLAANSRLATDYLIDILEVFNKYHPNFNCQNKCGRTPLHEAVSANNIDAVMCLLRRSDVREKSLDCKDNSGDTPLCIAVKLGRLSIVSILLDVGADVRDAVKCESGRGATLLHSCIGLEYRWRSEFAVVSDVLDCGADVNCKDVNDMTPLHYAAQKGQVKVALLLLDKGADIDCIDREGNAPIHVAAKEGYIDVVNVLLRKGCKCNCKNIDGKTPLCLAKEHGHEKIVSALKEYSTEGGVGM